jgi:hypothetical protein
MRLNFSKNKKEKTMNLDWDSEGEENLENVEITEEPVEGFIY